jgi:hypothetical protein
VSEPMPPIPQMGAAGLTRGMMGYAPVAQFGGAVCDVSRQRGSAWTNDARERHINPRDPARDTASARVLTASFEKMRLTCDFTVSGEISKVRAMRLLAKP